MTPSVWNAIRGSNDDAQYGYIYSDTNAEPIDIRVGDFYFVFNWYKYTDSVTSATPPSPPAAPSILTPTGFTTVISNYKETVYSTALDQWSIEATYLAISYKQITQVDVTNGLPSLSTPDISPWTSFHYRHIYRLYGSTSITLLEASSRVNNTYGVRDPSPSINTNQQSGYILQITAEDGYDQRWWYPTSLPDGDGVSDYDPQYPFYRADTFDGSTQPAVGLFRRARYSGYSSSGYGNSNAGVAYFMLFRVNYD